MIRFALLPALRLVAFAVLVACASSAARAATEAEAFVTQARLTVDRLMADKDFFALPKFVQSANFLFILPHLVLCRFILVSHLLSAFFLPPLSLCSCSPPALFPLLPSSFFLPLCFFF